MMFFAPSFFDVVVVQNQASAILHTVLAQFACPIYRQLRRTELWHQFGKAKSVFCFGVFLLK